MPDHDLLDANAACQLIGGTRPLHPSTLWRGVRAGIYPPPIKVSPNSNRWKRPELVEAVQRLADARKRIGPQD